MSTQDKTTIKVTLTGAMIVAALIWGGSIQAKVERVDANTKILQDINTRLSRIEGALGIKKDSGE